MRTSTQRDRLRVATLALAATLTLAQASQGDKYPYNLVFVPPTPLPPEAVEGTLVPIGIELQDGCDPFSAITWQVQAVPSPGSSATPGVDFMQPMPNTVTFTGPNGRFAMVDLQLLDDFTVEGPEDIDIRLTPMGNVDLDCGQCPPMQTEYILTLTILDDDVAPNPMLSIGDVSVVEGDTGQTAAVFDVTLTDPPAANGVSVNFTTADGTATIADGDYQVTAGQLNFDPAAMPGGPPMVQMISVPINGDPDFEGDEDFSVNLSMATGATIVDGTGVGTILNDDQAPPNPTLSIGDVTVVEGDAGQTAAIFDVTLQDPPMSGIVTVEYASGDGSATAASGDYQASTGQLVFDPAMQPGNPIVQTVTIPVNGDLEVEPDEDFFVRLSLADGADIADGTGRGQITDDDQGAPPDPPKLSISDVEVDEGDDGTTLATFEVSLDGPPNPGTNVVVEYRTNDGTAAANEGDYQRIAGQLVFEPGTPLVRRIGVPVTGDQIVEDDEVFFVQLLRAEGADLDDDNGRATIRDDDRPPPPDPPVISIDDVEVTEGDGDGTPTNARFTVSSSMPAPAAIEIPFATFDRTATANEDYQPRATTVTLPAGARSVPVVIPIVGDRLFEGDETFGVRLGETSDARVEDGEGIATIVDDDPEPVTPTLSIDDVDVVEGDAGATQAVFTITLTPASESDVSFVAATRDGAAIAGDDYQARTLELTLPAGARTTTFAVPVLGDTLDEADERFFVDLRDVVGAQVGDGQGRALIIDDDEPVAPPPDPPSLVIDDVNLAEGDTGTRPAIFRLRLSEPSTRPVAVDASTVDGSATFADGDFRPRASRLVIPPGEVGIDFPVPVVGDRRVEDDEVFSVALANVDGAVLEDADAQATIRNDDRPAGFVRLLAPEPVIEGDGNATVRVERTGDLRGAARVAVATADGGAGAGGATDGQDFVGGQAVARWSDGEGGVREVAFSIVDDTATEDDESFGVVLRDPVGVRIASPGAVQVTILDNDAARRTEALIGQDIRATARRQVELSVRTVRDDGSPVPGAPVRWRIVSGNAELLDDPVKRTDSEGISRQSVRLGRRPGIVQVAVSLIGRDAEVSFQIRADGDLVDLIDPNGAPNDAGLAGLLDGACADETEGEFAALCDFLFGLDNDDDRRQALAALRADGIAALADRGLRGARVQIRNIGGRLRAVRAGRDAGGGGDFDQLALNLRGQSLDVARLRRAGQRTALDVTSLASGGFGSADQRLAGSGLGGFDDTGGVPSFDLEWLARVDAALENPEATASSGSGGGSGGEAEAPPFDTGGSRWGVFVNGRVSVGDAPRTQRQAGYDFETEGLTAGVDYRFGESLVFGAAFGYLTSDTDLGRGRGEIDVEGYSLSGYFTYFRDRFYVDGILGWGRNDFEISRVLVLPRPFRGATRLVARGEPDGTTASADVGFGYNILGGALGLEAFGRLAYARTDIDGYRERGAGPFDLTFADQDLESLLTEAGLELSYPWSLSWGVLQPSIRVALLHEFSDDGRAVDVGFDADRARRRFRNRTDTPDRDFVNLGAALTATFKRGWAAYLQYDTDVARDDFDIYTVSIGVRKQLY